MKSETMFVDWLTHNAKSKRVTGGHLWNYMGGLFTPDEMKLIYELQVEPKLN